MQCTMTSSRWLRDSLQAQLPVLDEPRDTPIRADVACIIAVVTTGAKTGNNADSNFSALLLGRCHRQDFESKVWRIAMAA